MDIKPQIHTENTQISHARELDVGEYPHRDLTQQIIGAAFEVHRELGPGFLERVYENALVHELGMRGVSCVAQAEIPVFYKNRLVGSYFCDLLVEQKVICELKTVEVLKSEHKAQLLHYLKATGIKVGLLLNFHSKSLEVKRLVF